MQSQMVNVTTREIKKGRRDSKDLMSQVLELQDGTIILCIDETIQRLDKNQHFHPAEGSLVRLMDGRKFECGLMTKVGRPAQYALYCAPVQ